MKYLPPRTRPLDPPDELRELRNDDPIHRCTLWNGSEAWLVTRYSDARAILRDARFSADVTNPNFPRLSPARSEHHAPRQRLTRMDDPKHAVLRRMLVPEFTARRAEEKRQTIEALVNALITRLIDGGQPAEMVSGVAVPVPVSTICHLIGAPVEDLPFFEAQGRVLMSRSGSPEGNRSADKALVGYLEELVREKERRPTDDLIGRLVERHRRGGALSHEDLIDLIVVLVIAGHVTTASMIGLALLTMIQDPQVRRLASESPDRLTGTIEELLRFYSVVVDGAPRVATEDVAIGNVVIGAGQGVIVSLPSANRDGDQFDMPDELRPTRDAARHLAFGFGVHHCIGRWLARMEIQVVLATVAQRLPTLRLATPFDQLRFPEDSHVFGVEELSVIW